MWQCGVVAVRDTLPYELRMTHTSITTDGVEEADHAGVLRSDLEDLHSVMTNIVAVDSARYKQCVNAAMLEGVRKVLPSLLCTFGALCVTCSWTQHCGYRVLPMCVHRVYNCGARHRVSAA